MTITFIREVAVGSTPENLQPNGGYQFGSYELDLPAGELRKGGSLLRLKPQPFRVLALLVERAGEVITREELRERIWGADTFVDFERGLNSCMTQIRAVLNDDADSPRFIETLPRRGYRFLAPVERVTKARSEAPTAKTATGNSTGVAVAANPPVPLNSNWRVWGVLVFGLLLLAYLPLPDWFGARRPAAPAAGRVMLAVLPFQNLSGDPQQEFFGDGMTEEMIAVLGGLEPQRLGVIARTSAMRYKTTKKNVTEIAGELHVAYVVEGSIRREGDRARITAQLIRASDQSHLWAQSYERPMRDLIGVQRDVAQQIARALAIELVPSAVAALREKSAVDPAAYDEYLMGRQALNRMNGQGFFRAVEHFENAIRLDPQYAAAFAGLADAYNLQPWWGVAPPRVALEKGRAAALKALELDPNLADAHNSLAFVQLYYDWDLRAAERSFRRALELRPGFALAHYWYAGMLSAAGRHDQAIASIRRAQALDPFSELVNSDAGWYYFFARRYDQAIDQCRRTIALQPNFGWTYSCIYEAQVQKGQLAEAVETSRKLLTAQGVLPAKIDELLLGPPAEALNRVRRFQLARLPVRKPGYLSYFGIGLVHTALGEPDKAFPAFEQSIRERDSAVSNLKIDPRLDPLRTDPRFAELLRHAGI